MPICTYLDERQHTAPTTDSELNNLLADVRTATGRDWRVGERIIERRRWFRKPLVAKRYTIYLNTNGPEFQIVNLYRPDLDELSFGIVNEASHVAAYFYGLLAGLPDSA